jgi:hypothetical protein
VSRNTTSLYLRLAVVLAALLLALAGTADPVQAKNKKDKKVEKISSSPATELRARA